MTTDLPPPFPLDGQPPPVFPTKWYQDATPDRPFYIPTPPPPMPGFGMPVYTPPAHMPPPQHTGEFKLLVQAYDLGLLGWDFPPKLSQYQVYTLGRPAFATPFLSIRVSATAAGTGKGSAGAASGPAARSAGKGTATGISS